MLVYTGFQVKYIVSVVVLAIMTLSVLGYLYTSVLSEQNQLLGLKSVASVMVRPGGNEDDFERDMHAQFDKQDKSKVITLIVISALMVLLLALVSLRVTHRIAGPVYMVSNTLKALAMGSLDPIRSLRKRDEFAFLTDDLRALRAAMIKREERVVEMMDNVLEFLDSIEPPREEDQILLNELKSEIMAFVHDMKAGGKDE